MTIIPPERYLIALPDEELEKFAYEWGLLKGTSKNSLCI